jgi:O-antigen/teichoic acid export membrane protein
LPLAIFPVITGAVVGGYYALINRVIFNPANIITGVLGQSILPWLLSAQKKEANLLLLKISTLASMMLFGIVLVLYFWITSIFALIFGEEWREAGFYASLILWFLPYKIQFDILSVLLISENKQGILFIARGSTLIIGLLTIISLYEANPHQLFFWFSLSQYISLFFSILIILILLDLHFIYKFIIKSIIISFFYGIVTFQYYLKEIVGRGLLEIIFSLVGAIAIAYSITQIKLLKAN